MKSTQKQADESVLKKLTQAYGEATKARELLASWRWPHGPVGPHCHNAGDKRISKLEPPATRQHRVRQGVYFCGACRRQAVVNTDEHPSYKQPLLPWKAPQTVKHSRGEYQRQNPAGSKASTTTAEAFFALFKRAIIGAWHHISREHLSRYANEFAFRWNTRHDADGRRLETLPAGL